MVINVEKKEFNRFNCQLTFTKSVFTMGNML